MKIQDDVVTDGTIRRRRPSEGGPAGPPCKGHSVFLSRVTLALLAVVLSIHADVCTGFATPAFRSAVASVGGGLASPKFRLSEPSFTSGSAMFSSPAVEDSEGETSMSSPSWNWDDVTEDWELDCYSRPVLVDGKKKLWEVLLTDSSGNMRVRRTLPSNKVNSREVRRVVEEIIDESEVKPSCIRFFRGAMFNMINVALNEIDVVAKPSRCTFALAQWLEERNRDIYPKMEGYRPTMSAVGGIGGTFLDIRTAVKLPDALRGEKYAFVGLPMAEFLEGGSIDNTNIGVGNLCPVDKTLPADEIVQGVVILTARARALASWLAGTEVAGLKADLRKRELVMETDIDNQYLMAKLNEVQRMEAVVFEEGKDALGGLHFISVQRDEDDDPAGFWLLREIPENL